MKIIQLPDFMTARIGIMVNFACTMWITIEPAPHMWVNVCAIALQQLGNVYLAYWWGNEIGFERGLYRAVKARFEDAGR